MAPAARRYALHAPVLIVLGTACGGGDRASTSLFAEGGESEEGHGPDVTGAADDTAATATASSDGGADSVDTASLDDDGIKLDVGAPDTEGVSGEGGEGGCTYVDLLFVIDNSPSMSPYQEALAAAFPGFVDAMVTNLPAGTDLHVGITTTDFKCGSMGCSCSESTVNCASGQTMQEILDHYDTPDEFDNGGNGSQGRLFEHGGKTFFAADTSDDPAALKQWFTGAATAAGEVGCSYEMSSAGAGYAVHPANAAANADFLRDEGAVLMVFVLSDEPDKSPESIATYHDMLTAAKSGCGGDDCILTAGLLTPCVEATNQTIWEFLNSFGEAPIWGSIDATDEYEQVIGDALAQVVGETCSNIPPAG